LPRPEATLTWSARSAARRLRQLHLDPAFLSCSTESMGPEAPTGQLSDMPRLLDLVKDVNSSPACGRKGRERELLEDKILPRADVGGRGRLVAPGMRRGRRLPEVAATVGVVAEGLVLAVATATPQ
jgi:hypothetical protein